MPLKLTAPIRHEFFLTESDALFGNEGDPSRIEVIQALQDAIERRNQFWAEFRTKIDPEGNDREVIQNFPAEVLKRIEVFLTLASCNLLGRDGKKDAFRFANGRLDMTENEFQVAWGMLMPETADEIHKKVLEVNAIWDPKGVRSG